MIESWIITTPNFTFPHKQAYCKPTITMGKFQGVANSTTALTKKWNDNTLHARFVFDLSCVRLR